MILLSLLGCVPTATESDPARDRTPADTDTVPVDTGDEALAADDARVRALTGLPEGDSPCAAPQLVRILEAVDGDTVHAVPDGEDRYVRVRLIGIDTPEIAHEEPADCYGNEAWDYTSTALEGRLAWLTYDADCLDPYDRTLAYLFRDSDEAGFFNRQLLLGGYARTLTISPNDTFADQFASDARTARDQNVGLWAACER